MLSVTVTINGLVKLSAFNAHICSIQISSLLVKVEMVAADTTSSGNLFQWSTILWLNECFLNSSLELFLYSLRLCPLNSVVVAFWTNWSDSIFSLPVRIWYVSITSPLSLLRCNKCNPSAFNRCSHGILLKPVSIIPLPRRLLRNRDN